MRTKILSISLLGLSAGYATATAIEERAQYSVIFYENTNFGGQYVGWTNTNLASQPGADCHNLNEKSPNLDKKASSIRFGASQNAECDFFVNLNCVSNSGPNFSDGAMESGAEISDLRAVYMGNGGSLNDRIRSFSCFYY
ncbi:hypothetical protein A0O28_0104480 [Trichoderma guizhouense]|uniref:SSCRP protein n=1 Tax=Trichoderma guizhouense TaxID=1491466 RepID=A0A1T3CLD1_9HYPO|nr:hypothetical protein A0O28_0104480 [Trichoderma guizhouense]